ncbi:MAG: DUF4911 domain-containing protein [Desulfobacteraceae bacterium 4572_88]|nr:MAG: DUF4911 domain-containing protein [Desulfobacteraceae bacterium 4572_88]
MLETNKKYYRVERKAIAFLRFIFEAYDGIATVTSIDPGAGIVMLCIAPGCEAEVEGILDDLRNDMMIETRDEETIPFVP